MPVRDPIPGLNFVAIDFETANPKRASVCQIGLVKVRDGIPGRTHCLYVSPPPGFTNFHQRNIEVHGITKPDTEGAPSWDTMLDKLIAFTNTKVAVYPLVAHNAPFEKSVITQATEAIGRDVPDFTYHCTVKLAKRLQPEEHSHKLNEVAARLGVPPFAHHSAGDDAMASALIVLGLADQHGLRSLEDLWPSRPTAVRTPTHSWSSSRLRSAAA
jgi:DNA polymerase III subunit epsilon